MLIRSQDKRGFVNLENIDTVCISSEWEIFAFNNNAKSFIGKYSTEEKAIKVLDMIQKKYLEYEKMSGRVLNQYSATSPFAFIPPKVFQMPQDSEV